MNVHGLQAGIDSLMADRKDLIAKGDHEGAERIQRDVDVLIAEIDAYFENIIFLNTGWRERD